MQGKAGEVFWCFLLLGLTSFGGPAAHIGYFRRAFVEERGWLDDDNFGRLVGLSQFLPGPASSQLGFAIGLHRAGLAGAVMAFLGFTLPSFMLMLLLAGPADSFSNQPWFAGLVGGLKLLAVVVVADACLSMYRSFCTRTAAASLAVLSAMVLTLASGLAVQVLMLGGAALAGAYLLPGADKPAVGRRGFSLLPGLIFISLLGLLLMPGLNPLLLIARDFYLAGSLVFGGGHVVLPLLESLLAGTLGADEFLTGYAAAQAVPGPMFTLAAYLGALLAPQTPVLGAAAATLAIFLPGFLLLLACHDSWHRLSGHKVVAGAVRGVNAAVVGFLLAALYDPVFVSSVTGPLQAAMVMAGFFLLRVLKVNLALLVLTFALFGLLSVLPVVQHTAG